MEYHRDGLFRQCGLNGCDSVSTKDAAGFDVAARALGASLPMPRSLTTASLIKSPAGIIFGILIVPCCLLTAIASAAHPGMRSDLSRLAGMMAFFTGAVGVSAMASFVNNKNRQLLLAGANNVFYGWSFGVFTAAWAVMLGFVMPLLYIA
jgi:hypothetical protein